MRYPMRKVAYGEEPVYVGVFQQIELCVDMIRQQEGANMKFAYIGDMIICYGGLALWEIGHVD